MDFLTRLKNTRKPIVLYGMGNGADKIIDTLAKEDIKISGVFASDGFVRKKNFRGMPLLSYSEAKEQYGDMVVLMSFGSSLPDVLANVKKIASEQEFYVPEVPVVGEGLFTDEYALSHKEELESVYKALATDMDRAVFASLVNYKLSGDISSLYHSASDEETLYRMLSLTDKEIYMDCGAFSGDTVASFLKYSGGYEKIYAVEPDGRSYKKLCKNLEGMERVQCINAPLGVGGEIASFSAMGSRGSKLTDNGEERELKSIDGILNGEGASYIKIDVEGWESATIKGGQQTIKKYRPKLLVSCYHRREDIFALPLQILSLNPDYKVHLWHPMYLPPWDAAYIFV
ncbi:MAG: FkbM family methyltransferase [Clostridia bacterium]|nr:FkbM family methyltransferase [Clostridia bacterium]MBQ7048566.1 FkbM family methyltransferase [Clostridia bacterium]